MLHFGKFTGRNEGLTQHASRALALHFLTDGKNVIIDDTNLNDGTMQSWKDLAKELKCKFEIVEIDTPYDECITRDMGRQKSVGGHVIFRMALASGRYPKPAKGFVVCDIDGTIADLSHRRHHVLGEKKDWKSFYANLSEDTVRDGTRELLEGFAEDGYEIVYVSGRPEDYRKETVDWLKRYGLAAPLLMRRAGDSRDDTVVKQEIYDQCFRGKYDIYKVIDDRPRIIRMWRENGLDVIDVGDQIEF